MLQKLHSKVMLQNPRGKVMVLSCFSVSYLLDIGENRRLNAAVLGAFFAFDDDVPESNMASRFARRLPHRAFPEYAVQGTATLFQQEDARCLPGFYTHHRSYAPFSIH